MSTIRFTVAASVILSALLAPPASAAELTRDQVREQLAMSAGADLSGRDLSDLDLSSLDFRHANLAGASLFSARLVSSNLQGANLAHVNLNGAWLMDTDFRGAKMSDCTLMSIVVLGGEVQKRPNFAGADLSRARIMGDLPGADLSGAKLTNANLGVNIKNQGMGQMRTDLTGANLTGADLSGADLNRALLTFARLGNASLAGANLFRANLVGADLAGADVTGADFTEADLDGTILKGVKGLAAARGLDKAVNRDRAIFQ